MTAQTRIKTLSTRLYWTASILVFALPLAIIGVLLTNWADANLLAERFPALPDTTQITAASATIATLLGAVILVPVIIVLIAARDLFDRYRKGEILSEACAGHILRIGQLLLVLACLTVVIPTLQILALTFGNPDGQRVLSIGIGSNTVGLIMTSGFLVVIGWVMREAAAVAEDNKGFI